MRLHPKPQPPTSADTRRTPPGALPSPVRRTPRTPDTPDTGRTPPDTDTPRTPDTSRARADTDTGQGVRIEYRARVPRHQLGAAVAEAFAHIARETRQHSPDTGRTPQADTPPPARTPATRRAQSAAAIAGAFDVPQRTDPA
ncbi:hypothetical protein [Streptomyces sp. H27-H5]|uniref:hypothetical protein n=1 Tax=Streptomyces sp. H27-H5 TaxID=2996460 RepID=UPI00226FF3EE|nr:hypothetical protein [Streptomyces sp. H27-H5]MCY0957682.1 hypothetical protein [Streptomyces sp. H27-H5]